LVGYDFLNVVYYTGNEGSLVKHVLWTDTEEEAFAKTWIEKTVIIPNNATWVGFEFVSGTVPPEGGDANDAFTAYGVRITPSGSSGMKEGVFIDDVIVVGSDPRPEVPLISHVDALAAYQTDRNISISYGDNNPTIPMEWVYLYYRQSGMEEWTKYTNTVKPSGAFVSSPISFTAPSDGSYEFFTRGVDENNTLEVWRGTPDTVTTIDTVAPMSEIAISGSVHNGTYTAPVSFTLSGSDTTAGVDHLSYRMDGGMWILYASEVNLTGDDDHIIEYYATDKAHNDEAVNSVNITVVSPPMIAIQDNGKKYVDGNVTINFDLTASSIVRLEYSLDDSGYVNIDVNSTSLVLTGLPNGNHTLSVRATDAYNNVVVSQTEFAVGEEPAAPFPIVVVVAIGGIGAAGLIGAMYLRWRKRT
jgi:hypothetical protein